MGMIYIRFLWAVFASVILGVGFRRSWLKEYDIDKYRKGTLTADDTTEDTQVNVSPLIFVYLIIFFSVCSIIFSGFRKGLLEIGFFQINIILFFSFYFLILMAVLPFLRKRISSRACAVLWIVPVSFNVLCLNIKGYFYIPLYQIYIPEKILFYLIVTWFMGAIIVLAMRLIHHLIFTHEIHASAVRVKDENILQIFHEMQDDTRYHKAVKLIYSSKASGPFSIGILHSSRCLVLPERAYREEDLRMIFSHELHHLQRSDIDTKFFLVFITSMCWFNPLVWIAARKAAEDLELSCDEIVTLNMNPEERKRYALLLLNNTARQNAYGLTTCLSAAAGTLRYRMKNVVETRSKRVGIFLISAVIFLCIMLFGLIGITSEDGSFKDIIMKNSTYYSEDISEQNTDKSDNIYHMQVKNIDLYSYGNNIYHCSNPDQAKVLSTLGQIQLQKLYESDNNTYYYSMDEHRSLDIELASDEQTIHVNLYKDLVMVRDEDYEQAQYYKVVSKVDLDALREFF